MLTGCVEFFSGHTATEHKFDGQTKETIAKSEKRLNDLTLRYAQLNALFDMLETHADRYKTPKDVAFLPTRLLCDILEKEYEAVTPEEAKTDDFFRSNPTKFYRDVVHSMHEMRKKLIENNGNYFV
ncbi:unnamed protein product [Heligmosomoides polygyrus]|uniref:Type I site-specific deoxyribonuclease n=1 Tax=Heligmosomoides polygyrus TaxID=6339 RepID=A0A183FWF9_HELPZ|nr:unnamed protein product [Heligmosomoides polygyrus]